MNKLLLPCCLVLSLSSASSRSSLASDAKLRLREEEESESEPRESKRKRRAFIRVARFSSLLMPRAKSETRAQHICTVFPFSPSLSSCNITCVSMCLSKGNCSHRVCGVRRRRCLDSETDRPTQVKQPKADGMLLSCS